VAAAASHAALTIYEEEGLFERAAGMSAKFLDAVFSLQDLPVVTDIRGYGLLAGIDLAPLDMPGQRGTVVLQELWDAGLVAKLTGDCALISPPLVCEEQHIDEIVEKLRAVLKKH
jgi:beta-alanine--pyruvate transaminase